jgi:hypothetical protein
VARYRFTGAGTAGFSAQWERKDDDREIARRVLNLLSDRRLLWIDLRYEVPEECIQSASVTRDRLSELMNHPEIGAGLEQQLKAMQRALRDFMTSSRRYHDDWPRWSTIGPDEFSVALGELRAIVGLTVGTLAAEYDLEVADELATIVPDEAAWFFERFDGEA